MEHTEIILCVLLKVQGKLDPIILRMPSFKYPGRLNIRQKADIKDMIMKGLFTIEYTESQPSYFFMHVHSEILQELMEKHQVTTKFPNNKKILRVDLSSWVDNYNLVIGSRPIERLSIGRIEFNFHSEDEGIWGAP